MGYLNLKKKRNLIMLIFILAFTFLLFLPTIANAQVTEAWIQRYNSPNNQYDIGKDIEVDSNRNVYVAGDASGFGTLQDYATIKYDENGNQLWMKRYNGPSDDLDSINDLAIDASGNVYVTGNSWDTNSDYLTIKYDTNGNELWVKRYNGPGNSFDMAMAVIVDMSGNVYVAGYSYGGGGTNDYATIKYDSAGNEVWVRRYDGPASGTDEARCMVVDTGGNVIVSGSSTDFSGKEDIATIKYDTNGNQLWIERYNSPANEADIVQDITIDSSDNLYLTGCSDIVGGGAMYDYTTVKYDSAGNMLWARQYDAVNGWDMARAIDVDSMGNAYVTGGSEATPLTNDKDCATIKYDSAGNVVWIRRYDGPVNGWDEACCITVSSIGNIYIVGKSGLISGEPGPNYVTIGYDVNGNMLWSKEYNGPGNGGDFANCIVLDTDENIYITGESWGGATGMDFATIKYIPTSDSQPPDSFTLNLPANGATVNKPYPYFSWNPSSDSGSGLAKYQLYIDGSLARDNIVDWTAAVPVNALSNGSHTWFVRAWDNAGNYTDTATRSFTVNAGAGKIVFTSNRDGNYEVYVMNADGSNQTSLTNNSAYDWQPALSPDGNKIAFVSYRDGNDEIYTMNTDGTNLIRVTNHSSADWEPIWSPDGSKIAFSSERDGNLEIYVMNSDGTGLMRLTSNTDEDRGPVFSPDGRKIVFQSDSVGNREIFMMNTDGSNQINLTNNLDFDSDPSWSPSGSMIAFYSNRDLNTEIYLMNQDGTGQSRLTNDLFYDTHPSFSNDGTRIAFQRNMNENNEIYIMDLDGSGQTNLTNNSADDSWPKCGSGLLTGDTAPPSTPTLSGSASSSTQINLSWTASTDNVGVAGYRIYNADTHALLATTTSTSRSFSGLSPNTTYRYYVKAYDAANNYSDASNTVAITTPSATPGGPTGIVAKVGDMKNTLSWNPVSNATYNVYRSTSSTGMYFLITSSPISSTSYTDEPGTKGIYYYKISSVVSGVESSLSAAVEANFVDMTKSVSTSGGTLDALNGAVKTEVPSDALSESKDIAVVQISAPASAPTGLRFVSNAYDFGPSGTSFDSNHPVTITLKYNETMTDPSKIDVYWHDGSSWQKIADGRTVNTTNNTISVDTTHFTPFVVMSSGYGVSTGYNTNIFILTALSAIAGGILLIGKLKFIMI